MATAKLIYFDEDEIVKIRKISKKWKTSEHNAIKRIINKFKDVKNDILPHHK